MNEYTQKVGVLCETEMTLSSDAEYSLLELSHSRLKRQRLLASLPLVHAKACSSRMLSIC